MGCELEEPLAADLGDGADVLFSGEDVVVVEDPLGAVVEDGGGVEGDGLAVLRHKVLARGGLEVRDLHEEAGDERLADARVVLGVRVVRARERDALPRHDTRELCAHTVCRAQRSVSR